MVIDTRPVRTDADIAAVTQMVWAFFDLLRARYPERQKAVDRYITHQDVAAQLADFRTHFNPPAGECLLGLADGAPAGIVMLKPERPGCAELNRMYVTDAARGQGLGRLLARSAIEAARDLGYTDLRLGALDRHVEALPLYRSLGFQPDPDPPPEYAERPGVFLFHMKL